MLHLLFNTGTHLCHSIFQSYIIAYYVGCGGDRWQIRCWTCPGWTIRQRTCELFLDKYAVIRGVFATSEVYWHIDHALATRISKMDRSCWIFVTTQQPRRKAVLSVISSEGNEVFWIGLGIVVDDENGGTCHIIHSRIEQLKLVTGFGIGRELTVTFLAPIAHYHAAQEHMLRSIGIWRGVGSAT